MFTSSDISVLLSIGRVAGAEFPMFSAEAFETKCEEELREVDMLIRLSESVRWRVAGLHWKSKGKSGLLNLFKI